MDSDRQGWAAADQGASEGPGGSLEAEQVVETFIAFPPNPLPILAPAPPTVGGGESSLGIGSTWPLASDF